jgi:hypothetical protein
MPESYHSLNSEITPKSFLLIIIVIICWYLLLCVVHYLNQRPLWNDEQCVLQSVETFTAKQVFSERLLAIQVFPRFYLFLIQKVSQPFDFHLLSLRFLPFVSMVCAFLLWLKLATYEIKNKFEYLTFALSWAASVPLIYYAAELKQYSMDVLTAALFIMFLYHQKELEESPKNWLYALILILLPSLGMLSYTAFLFMVFPLYNLIVSSKTNGSNIRFIILYGFSFLIFVLLSYFFDMRLRPTVDVTEGFGDYFISFESFGEFFKTLGEGIANLFSRWFAESPRIVKKIAIYFVTFGLINLFYSFFKNIKKDRYFLQSLNTIALVVFIELFILGALKKYPFTVPRTSLFFCPIVLYLTITGIANIRNLNKYAYGAIHGLYFIFLSIISVSIARLIFTGDLGAIPKIW